MLKKYHYLNNVATEKGNQRLLKVAAYCRVSKNGQEQLSSLKMQTEYYTKLINSNTEWVSAGVYSDVASGLRVEKRNGYKEMIRNCKKGKIDLIIVKSISRFGRDALEIIKQIRFLKSINVGIYFEIGGINTMTTPALTYEILAAAAEEESFSKSENIKWGIR
ncbi:MAG: recombinase family protein, partial [Clostridiales Family XIII bacterium]|nr:recombinase family protein [Clostridiales Family XIII bacterium]